ncbi:MAG: histidine kinase [Bacteroidota bacterium]
MPTCLQKKDPEKASQVLMKLSDLLRYQLYDSARNKVLLTADIHFLTDFLNLEKIRRDNFEFSISQRRRNKWHTNTAPFCLLLLWKTR